VLCLNADYLLALLRHAECNNYSSEYVGVVWCVQILKCISQLELAQLIGTFVKTRYITGPGNQTSTGHTVEAFDPEGKL